MLKKPKRPRMGRPPKPPGSTLDTVIGVRVTSAERTLLEAAARRAGSLLTPWARERLLEAAREAGRG